MTSWAKHISDGAKTLLGCTVSFSDAAKESPTLVPETQEYWDRLADPALKSEDLRNLRYLKGQSIADMRARLFPNDTVKDVAALFEAPVRVLAEIEDDLKAHPNLRCAYATRLIEWENACAKERQDKAAADAVTAQEAPTAPPVIAEPPPSTPIPTTDASAQDEEKLKSLRNRAAILLTPQDQRDRAEARRLATAMLRIARHGFGVWFCRKHGLPPYFLSDCKNSYFRNSEENRTHLRAFLHVMQSQAVEDAVAEFGATKDAETRAANRSRSEFGSLLGEIILQSGKRKADFLKELALRSDLGVSTIYAYMASSSEGVALDSKRYLLSQASKMLVESGKVAPPSPTASLANEEPAAAVVVAEEPVKQNPPFEVGQVWSTRNGDEATIVYLYKCGHVKAYMRDGNEDIQFDQAWESIDGGDDALVEYLRETDRLRLEVGKKYRTQSDSVVKIIKDDGTGLPFLADDNTWYWQFGFHTDDPIVGLVEEESAQPPAGNENPKGTGTSAEDVLQFAVRHVLSRIDTTRLRTEYDTLLVQSAQIKDKMEAASLVLGVLDRPKQTLTAEESKKVLETIAALGV